MDIFKSFRHNWQLNLNHFIRKRKKEQSKMDNLNHPYIFSCLHINEILLARYITYSDSIPTVKQFSYCIVSIALLILHSVSVKNNDIRMANKQLQLLITNVTLIAARQIETTHCTRAPCNITNISLVPHVLLVLYSPKSL